MAKRLYDVLKDCNKEEEVKSEFCKFFKMKINALKSIDHYTPNVLFEFKGALRRTSRRERTRP